MEIALTFRLADLSDLPEIIRLLREDELGQAREILAAHGVDPVYLHAFGEIQADPNQALMVVEEKGKVIGTCHLTFMPSLTFQGGKRMNIEAVRVDQTRRNQKIGEWMIKKAIEMAEKKRCKLIQLTTNKKRVDAKRFYEKLGFSASHEGMKHYL